MSVRFARIETILRLRTKQNTLAGWNTKNTAVSAENILFIKRLNNGYVSGSIGRAAVSKTAGWGFESLLTCENLEKFNQRKRFKFEN